MELINKQDAIKALRDTFLGDTYEIDAVACGTIECLKAVEAIPVSFIQQEIGRYYKDEVAATPGTMIYWLIRSKRLGLQYMIERWKKEQEEER